MFVFIKLHITAQSGPVMLVILQYAARIDPLEGGSMILITKISDQTRQCVCVCVLSSHLSWTSGLWTYQPGSHWRKVTQDFSSTFLLQFLLTCR